MAARSEGTRRGCEGRSHVVGRKMLWWERLVMGARSCRCEGRSRVVGRKMLCWERLVITMQSESGDRTPWRLPDLREGTCGGRGG
jgi:hypothetical protein